MPIRSYLEDHASFDPEAIAAMSRAFEQACAALQVFAGDARGREIIASRIIDLARGGVVDAGALRDRVVSEGRLSL
jgi:hypothetical protein